MQPQMYPDVSNIYANPSGAAPTMGGPSIADIYANPSAAPSAQPPAANPAPAAHSGNWFTHLLPTGGAIAGGAGGAALGSLILPGLGTIAGGILGAALGGGGAKAAENAAEGKGIGNDVGETALESGAGQAVGGVAGKVLGKGAELLAGRAGKILDSGAAQKAIDDRALALKDIPNQTQVKLNANDSLDHVQNMGFDPTNAEHVTQVGQTSNDVLNSTLDQALANSGKFDLSNYPQMVKDALANHSDVLDSYEKVAMSRGRLSAPNTPAAKLLAAMENLGMGKATTSADPNEIRTLTTKLGDMAQKYRGSDLPQDKATYDAINEVRSNVKNALYNRPEVNDALSKLEGNISPEDVGGSQPLADHLNNVLTTAGATGNTPAQDLLSEISRNINVSDLGDQMSKVRQIATSTGAQARAANDAGIQNANTNEILDAGHAVTNHGGLISTALNMVGHAKDNPKILDTLSRIGDLGSKLAPATGAAVGAANAQLTDPSAAGGTMGGVMPQTQDPNAMAASAPAAVPTNGLSRDDLITLALYSPSAFSSLITPSAVNQQSVSAANTAEQALSGLNAPPSGGIMSQLAGKLGLGSTGEYQRTAQNVAQQVAAALPGSNEAAIAKELTDYTAGSGSIQEAIAKLMQNLQAVKQNNTNGSYQQLMNYQPSVIGAAGL